jgi:hypothetical protein
LAYNRVLKTVFRHPASLYLYSTPSRNTNPELNHIRLCLDTMPSDIAANDFGFIVGAFAILGAIFSFRWHLPRARLAVLNKALLKARSELAEAMEAGFVCVPQSFNERLVE